MAKWENNRMALAIALNNLGYNSKVTKKVFQDKITRISWTWEIWNRTDKESGILDDRLLRNIIFTLTERQHAHNSIPQCFSVTANLVQNCSLENLNMNLSL